MKQKNTHPAIEVLENYIEAYNERDLDRIMDLFCTQHKVHLFGTGVDENREGRDGFKEQLLRDWEQSESNILTQTSPYIASDRPACWATAVYRATYVIGGETHILDNLRGSIYCVEEDGLWKISQMHASTPTQNQEVDSSFPLDQKDLVAM